MTLYGHIKRATSPLQVGQNRHHMPAERSPVAAYLLGLAQRSDLYASRAPSRVVALAAPGDPLPDSSGRYLLVDAAGRPVAFGFESSRAAPGAVARDARNARRAHAHLGDEVGGAVLTATAEGDFEGTSIALYPACEPLASTRLAWLVQRPAIRRWAFGWLRAVAARTVRVPECENELTDRFERPLEHLAALEGLQPHMRRDAASALERLRSRRWRPRLVLMHGDLWKGNILERRSIDSHPSEPTTVAVIDWGTSEVDGYALFDLVRISQSLKVRRTQLRNEVATHLGALRCDPVDARGYVLAALGHRALNLEFFPFANFLRMAESCHATIREAS